MYWLSCCSKLYCSNRDMQYSLTLIGLYSLKVGGSLGAEVDGPAWVVLCCVKLDGPASLFLCCLLCVDERVSVEVCWCCLPRCLCRRLKCVTLSVGTEEMCVSIDNFTRLRPSTISGRTCYTVRSVLCWFAAANLNILFISVTCHIKRKKKY